MEMKTAGTRQPREFHEQHDTLLRLQAGLERAVSVLQELKGFAVDTLPVDDRRPEQVAQELLDRYVA